MIIRSKELDVNPLTALDLIDTGSNLALNGTSLLLNILSIFRMLIP